MINVSRNYYYLYFILCLLFILQCVVDAINRSAFVNSPYPVVLSIENHCCLQQQAKMAQIFTVNTAKKKVLKFIAIGMLKFIAHVALTF